MFFPNNKSFTQGAYGDQREYHSFIFKGEGNGYPLVVYVVNFMHKTLEKDSTVFFLLDICGTTCISYLI